MTQLPECNKCHYHDTMSFHIISFDGQAHIDTGSHRSGVHDLVHAPPLQLIYNKPLLISNNAND